MDSNAACPVDAPVTNGREPVQPREAAPSVSEMKAIIEQCHYSHRIPTTASEHYYYFEGAIIVFGLPANRSLCKWLLGVQQERGKPLLLELTRLWAPDGHDPNLMTRAITHALKRLRHDEQGCAAVISFADPDLKLEDGVRAYDGWQFGHTGGVYQAASWRYLGQSSETRYFRDPKTGQRIARRAFSAGADAGATTRAGTPRKFRTDKEIVAEGFIKCTGEGKHRYAVGLTPKGRKSVHRKWTELGCPPYPRHYLTTAIDRDTGASQTLERP